MNVAKLEMHFFAIMFANVVDTVYMLEVQVVHLGNKIRDVPRRTR